MKTTHPQRLRVAAGLLALHSVLLTTAFFVLAAVFEFPAVLREPPERILELFRAEAGTVRATYYLFTLTGLSFVAMATVAAAALAARPSAWNRFAQVAGVLAGLTQAIGFVRWVWFVPAMAEIAADPTASEARREAALVTFEAVHQFAGVSVGENLSFAFQGLWTLGLSIALARTGSFDRRLSALGVLSGASFLVYTLEQFGGPWAVLGELNVLFHVAWLTWLALVALSFWRVAGAPAPGRLHLGRRTLLGAALGAGLLWAAASLGG